jgi:hypothetical protein
MGMVRACDDCSESTENTFSKALTDVTEIVSHVGSTCKGRDAVLQWRLVSSSILGLFNNYFNISGSIAE